METINTRLNLQRASKSHALRNKGIVKKSSSQGIVQRSALGEISSNQHHRQDVESELKPGNSKAGVKVFNIEKPATESPVDQITEDLEECFRNEIDVEDIDKNDTENPQLCTPFVKEIYRYLMYFESQLKVRQHYLKETNLRPKMRSILVDWLIQVHHRFQLLQETLYVAISILDRYLQVESVKKEELQLVGVTALHIASKYEEMYAPELNDYIYISDDSFTRQQIIQMEIKIFNVVGFALGRPIPLVFLRRYSKAGNVEPTHHFMAKYLMELSLVDYDMCHVLPSKVAAAALFLSLKIIDNRGDWSKTLQFYSQYEENDIYPVVCHLAKNLKNAFTNSYSRFIGNKYSNKKLLSIAKIRQLDDARDLIQAMAEEANNLEL